MNILIPTPPGVEEMELVIIADVLRRAQWNVTLAGLEPGMVTASRGIQIQPDVPIEDCSQDDIDALILPGGGPGTQVLCQNPVVQEWIRLFHQQQKWIGAICAAPLALERAGILQGQAFTAHPSTANQFTSGTPRNESVVVHERLITGKGPGAAFPFALTWVEIHDSPEKAQKLAYEMCLA